MAVLILAIVLLWLYGTLWAVNQVLEAQRRFRTLGVFIFGPIWIIVSIGYGSVVYAAVSGGSSLATGMCWILGGIITMVCTLVTICGYVVALRDFWSERDKPKMGWVSCFGRQVYLPSYTYKSYPFGKLVFWLWLCEFTSGFSGPTDDEIASPRGKVKYRYVIKVRDGFVSPEEWRIARDQATELFNKGIKEFVLSAKEPEEALRRLFVLRDWWSDAREPDEEWRMPCEVKIELQKLEFTPIGATVTVA